MIFYEYLRISGANNIRGRCTKWAQPTWARRTPIHALVCCGPHVGPLTYPFTPHHHLPPEKFSIALSPVFLLSNPWISISLLEAPFLKLFRGIVAWYVTPPFVQLVFVLVVYIFNN